MHSYGEHRSQPEWALFERLRMSCHEELIRINPDNTTNDIHKSINNICISIGNEMLVNLIADTIQRRQKYAECYDKLWLILYFYGVEGP